MAAAETITEELSTQKSERGNFKNEKVTLKQKYCQNWSLDRGPFLGKNFIIIRILGSTSYPNLKPTEYLGLEKNGAGYKWDHYGSGTTRRRVKKLSCEPWSCRTWPFEQGAVNEVKDEEL